MKTTVGSAFLAIIIGLNCVHARSAFSRRRYMYEPNEEALEESELLRPIETSTVKRTIDDDHCGEFVSFPKSLILQGNVMRHLGHGYTASECRQACVDTTDFTCAAALMQPPGRCYLSGYHLLRDHDSVHFERTCSHGASCFKPTEGYSAGFTDAEVLPSFIAGSSHLQPIYCMVQCQRREMCVGVDFKQNPARCVFMDLGAFHDPAFNLFIRRC